MKTYKNYTKALKESNGLPIIRISGRGEQLYIVLSGDTIDAKLTQVELIAHNGGIAGQVGLGHLNRLGNANWAESKDDRPRMKGYDAFPEMVES